MTMVVTTDYALSQVAPPRLPSAPDDYQQQYQDQLNNVLRLYFNQLNKILGQLVASSSTPIPVSIDGTNTDAFGRLRVSQPYTLFDSQNRYAADNQFDTSTATGGTTTYLGNEAAVQMSVTTSSGSEVVRQSYRSMPYQPGKGLLVLATFVMNAAQTGLRQRVGYFNTQNGVFFQQADSTKSFVLRSYISGAVSDVRTVPQSSWNGDKLDGTGASGITLDASKAQILWMDFEWLGVGSVRCGFIIDGTYIVCHTFNNANSITSVYMTTAILPVRYEITNTSATAAASSMKQICCSVVSEAGFEESSADHVVRRTTALATIGTTFLPLISFRLNSSALGAVVLPNRIQVLPTTSQNYEVALVKNATLTGASWVSAPDDSNVQYDITSSAVSGGTIVQTDYVTSSGSGGTRGLSAPSGYNWDLQLGASLAGVSDILTVQIRTVSGATTGDAVGSITYWDLTQ
ncbi:hypothetical protein UFOVP274_40 [uncultured Caudovirales phage]|uniref:Uncharacterized protein n=1 Tax=uncultured Caudovirales phage TaxID=2100421 RepID=A0A6J5LKH0_9CAUD|nr:hypothetical protein UFOVP274_40 [uncultured Caudovirales phage]